MNTSVGVSLSPLGYRGPYVCGAAHPAALRSSLVEGAVMAPATGTGTGTGMGVARAQDGDETNGTTSQTDEAPTTETTTTVGGEQADTYNGAAGAVPEPGIVSGLNETGAGSGGAVPEMNLSVSGGAQVTGQGGTVQPLRDQTQGDENGDVGGQTAAPAMPP